MIGLIADSAATPQMQPPIPETAVPRRTRRGSSFQRRIASGSPSTSTISAVARILGKTVPRNATVSESMIMTSMKLAVIESSANLNRETATSETSIANDSAAERPGRRSRRSQQKLVRPQAKMKTASRKAPNSLQIMTTKAARWNAAAGANRANAFGAAASDGVTRLARDERNGGMRGAPVPGPDQ